MVIFTNGLYSSSYASFYKEIKNIVGVKSVVVSRRPKAALI